MVKEKIKNLAPGAFFNAGPAVVTVLEHFADGRTLLAAKEPIGNRPFTVRPFTYNRTDPEPNPNNFAFSSLRYDLNTDFLDALNDAGVIPADKVLEAEWSLAYPTAEAVSKSEYKTSSLSSSQPWWWWLLTPNAGDANDVRNVDSGGSPDWGNAWNGNSGVRPAFFVDSEICLFLEPDEVELSDAALLREFTSKQLADEVLRRIAAGEDDEDE